MEAPRQRFLMAAPTLSALTALITLPIRMNGFILDSVWEMPGEIPGRDVSLVSPSSKRPTLPHPPRQPAPG